MTRPRSSHHNSVIDVIVFCSSRRDNIMEPVYDEPSHHKCSYSLRMFEIEEIKKYPFYETRSPTQHLSSYHAWWWKPSSASWLLSAANGKLNELITWSWFRSSLRWRCLLPHGTRSHCRHGAASYHNFYWARFLTRPTNRPCTYILATTTSCWWWSVGRSCWCRGEMSISFRFIPLPHMVGKSPWMVSYVAAASQNPTTSRTTFGVKFNQGARCTPSVVTCLARVWIVWKDDIISDRRKM